jgi:hypothetical protein
MEPSEAHDNKRNPSEYTFVLKRCFSYHSYAFGSDLYCPLRQSYRDKPRREIPEGSTMKPEVCKKPVNTAFRSRCDLATVLKDGLSDPGSPFMLS